MTDRARSEFQAWWSRQSFNAQFEDVKQQMENVWVASRANLKAMTFYGRLKYACCCMLWACALALLVLGFVGVVGLIGQLLAPVALMLMQVRP